MRKLAAHRIGVDEGEIALFSDFQDDGEMWTGLGPRERRRQVTFAEPYLAPPVVHCAMSMWDLDNGSNLRGDIQAQDVTEEGFAAVFRTWGDTRVARIRLRWIAFGEVRSEDDWDV